MNIISDSSKYQDLSEESRIEQQRHAEVLHQYERKRRARQITVPTAPEDVKLALRELGHPATLFGEDHADRRDRLREVLAEIEIRKESTNESVGKDGTGSSEISGGVGGGKTAKKDTLYSPALDQLIEIRQKVAPISFTLAEDRLRREREISTDIDLQHNRALSVFSLYRGAKEVALNFSQFGDDRPLTAIQYSSEGSLFATGSFGSSVKIWDSSSLECQLTLRGHTDRITSISWQPSESYLASSSSDGNVMIWDLNKALSHKSHVGSEASPAAQRMGTNESQMDVDDLETGVFAMSRQVAFRHKIKVSESGAAVSSCSFHSHCFNLLAASCHDFTWRLFDVSSGQEVLVQDGHSKECSALGFHPDGALVLSADAAGIAMLWDLRSGQMIQSFVGHVKKISSVSFNANGFQVATGALDNSVRVWDLRQRKCAYNLPAHSNLVSDCTYSSSGELLLTSSFDGSMKIFGARDLRLIKTLTGHSGKIMACCMSPNERSILSAGYDRTVKLWTSKVEDSNHST